MLLYNDGKYVCRHVCFLKIELVAYMKRADLAKKHHPLKDTTIDALESEASGYRVRDTSDRNLHLYVRPDGRKSWDQRIQALQL